MSHRTSNAREARAPRACVLASRAAIVLASGAVIAAGALSLTGCSSTRPVVAETATALPRAAPSAAQREHVLRTVAGFKHLGFQVVAARLRLGVDTALAWRQLDTLLAKPTGDIFWMYPATGFYLTMRSKLDDAWRERFRRTWKTYTPYRGDTENHFLMYYTSLLLMSQEWPALPGSEWFNGKSSQENLREATEYLEHWIDEAVRLGPTEWDSPRYAYYYITPLVLLRDFVADPTLRRRCEMMLELTLADYAAEYLAGSYVGAHSRDGDGSVVDPRRAEVTSYAQLYFTDSIAFVLPDLAFAAMSDWQCPPIIRAIAHDRDSSYVHTETKRSRARMRFSVERFTTVRKYDYITPDYALGSIQGGVHQPIQQHTWDVTFAAPRPNNTLFALHPTWSAEELGTFFPEDPTLMIESVARAKASYTNPNKWIGGSPNERVAQHGSSLVAEYAIPAGDPVQSVSLFLPMSADTIVHDASGWWFVRFGDAFVAVTGGDSSTVEGPWRRVRTGPTAPNGAVDSGRVAARFDATVVGVVVTCARAEDVDWADFVRNVLRSPHDRVEPLGGDRARYTIVDGLGVERRLTPPDAASLYESHAGASFDGPHIHQSAGASTVKLRWGPRRRVLDFDRVDIRQ